MLDVVEQTVRVAVRDALALLRLRGGLVSLCGVGTLGCSVGRSFLCSTLVDGVGTLVGEGCSLVGCVVVGDAVVGVTVGVAPVGPAACSVPQPLRATHSSAAPLKIRLARILFQLKSWGMAEIFLAGILVSFVKLMAYGDIGIGSSFIPWCLFCILQLYKLPA
ncbi:paraquat-inducible protein A [Dermacoccus nishinomiyaensis]|uniref:paraquat-inducible protein A n=1 Tax=Dermacoccus nishinomiyaensis TaxID=1274 RepID=UPI003CD0C88D